MRERLKRFQDAENRVVVGCKIPIYVNSADFARVIAEGVEALSRIDVYQNADNVLTRYLENPTPCKHAKHDNGAPRLDIIPAGAMLEVLSGAAQWMYNKGDDEQTKWVASRPDTDIRSAILSRRHYPGVKVAYGVVSSPILSPEGEIITTPGYDTDSGLILNIDGDWPALMTNADAVEKLSYVVCDFPFEGPSHKSAWFAALLTLICRYLIAGNTPFHPVDGNRPGCGKGLATDAMTMIAEGRRASRYVFTGNQDELRKALTSLAIAGRNYILFDNVKGRFGGPVLEAAMTTGGISDRVLGASKNVELPLAITWLATVNGMTYERDMLRRSVPIMLNTDHDNPQLREGFKEPRLLDYIEANRRELLIAGLSIVANYIRAGKPQPEGGIPSFGSFEEWSDLIRGAVIHAGFDDPCLHCAELYDEISDEVTNTAEELIKAWAFDVPVTVKQAMKLIDEGPDKYPGLVEILRRKDEDATDGEFLGKLLRSIKGKVIDGKCLAHDGRKRRKWAIQQVCVNDSQAG